jgi:hypothetical protein
MVQAAVAQPSSPAVVIVFGQRDDDAAIVQAMKSGYAERR